MELPLFRLFEKANEIYVPSTEPKHGHPYAYPELVRLQVSLLIVLKKIEQCDLSLVWGTSKSARRLLPAPTAEGVSAAQAVEESHSHAQAPKSRLGCGCLCEQYCLRLSGYFRPRAASRQR
jgi:hypothetical protein